MKRRIALVTGGSRGIGKAVVLRLARAGFDVAINYNVNEEAALALAGEVKKLGRRAIVVCADVSDVAQVEEMQRIVRTNLGFCDTLVCCAGKALEKLVCDCTVDDFDKIIGVNLKGVFNAVKVFAPEMVSERFGRIVNIASVWGERGGSCESLYSASKGGVIAFTKAINAELGPSGVIANCVSPGMINTDMTAHYTDEEIKAFLDGTAVGRVGSPMQVADVVELLTREDLYIAGENVSVNGGML